MNQINVACATNNFGLGPVGKICSIVNAGVDYNWYAIGNRFDTSIFEEGVIKDSLWSKDKELIAKFVKERNIQYAVVVLDSELAFIFMELGVKVIFVDSLPFMWTQADIDQNLLPLNVDYYCAQKCINLTEASKKVLAQIKNLIWIDPIGAPEECRSDIRVSDNVLINFGGLHSPFGNGEYYIDVVCPALFKALSGAKLNNVTIACGKSANDNLRDKMLEYAKQYNINLVVKTFTQQDFHTAVRESKLFMTSPGLTTIYETMKYDKQTVLLPPQNLSQFYNIKYGQQLLKYVKAIDWNTKELSDDGLKDVLPLGECRVVEIIYDRISQLNNKDYIAKLSDNILEIINKPFEENKDQVQYGNTGAKDICSLINKLLGENV